MTRCALRPAYKQLEPTFGFVADRCIVAFDPPVERGAAGDDRTLERGEGCPDSSAGHAFTGESPREGDNVTWTGG